MHDELIPLSLIIQKEEQNQIRKNHKIKWETFVYLKKKKNAEQNI